MAAHAPVFTTIEAFENLKLQRNLSSVSVAQPCPLSETTQQKSTAEIKKKKHLYFKR